MEPSEEYKCIWCGSKDVAHCCDESQSPLFRRLSAASSGPDAFHVFETIGTSPTRPITPPTSGEHDPNRALHFSDGKSGVDQIPPEVLLELGDIYTYGEKKYFRDNWKKGNDWHQFYGSALRHLLKFWDGEDIDPESELPHLAHAIWNLVTLRYYQRQEIGTDDRYTELSHAREVLKNVQPVERQVIVPHPSEVADERDVMKHLNTCAHPDDRINKGGEQDASAKPSK